MRTPSLVSLDKEEKNDLFWKLTDILGGVERKEEKSVDCDTAIK